MRPILVEDLGRILGAEPVGFDPEAEVQGFALDSRDVEIGDLFLAVKGAQVDGHEYLQAAFNRGAVGSLMEREVAGPHIRVHNLVHALAQIGMHFRAQFKGPVIGITGSAGKTTTKEFVAAALAPLGPVLKTEGNRNTEYTSPLLWTELMPQHRTAVVEMGMRGFGHIAHLARISQPTIALITNVGYSHMELVGSQEGVARAKAEILDSLPSDGVALLPADDAFLPSLMLGVGGRAVRTFGFSESADCRVLSSVASGWTSSVVRGTLNGREWAARVPAVGRHIALNAAAAVLAACTAGVSLEDAASALEGAVLPPMRMEIREVRGATVVSDVYNASPASTIAAIESLAAAERTGRKFAVIGEMRELGPALEEGHRSVGRALASASLDDVLFFGEPTRFAMEELGAGRMVSSLGEISSFLAGLQAGGVVLLKGSRALELERALEPVGAGA